MPKVSKENRELHKEWREKVLERDGNCCVICGVNPNLRSHRLNAHHLIPKEFSEYRWDVDNGMTLCVHHHTLGKLSAHKNPIWFCNWMIDNKPGLYTDILQRIKVLI